MAKEEYDLPEEYEEPEEDIDYDDLSKEQQEELKWFAQKKMRKMKKTEAVTPTPNKPQKTKKKFFSEKAIMGKYMLKDMPLFKYEIIIYLLVGFVAFVLYILERTAIAPGAFSRAIIPAILIPVAFWFVKWMFYMPNKKRIPSLRIYNSGVLELLVEDVSKGYITYGSGENAQKKYLARMNKHTEASTGKPFLITSETQGHNLSLLETTKPDLRSKEFNSLMEMNTTTTTKTVMNKMLKSVQPSMQNPLFLIMAANLALTAVVLAKEFGLLDMIKGG